MAAVSAATSASVNTTQATANTDKKGQTSTGKTVQNITNQKTIGQKILAVACLVACIAVTLLGLAGLVGMGLNAANFSFFPANVMGFVASYITPIGGWVAAGVITVVGLGSLAWRITKPDNSKAGPAAAAQSKPKPLSKEELAAAKAKEELKVAEDKLKDLKTKHKAASDDINKYTTELKDLDTNIKKSHEECSKIDKSLNAANSELNKEKRAAKKAGAQDTPAMKPIEDKIAGFKKDKEKFEKRIDHDDETQESTKKSLDEAILLEAKLKTDIATADSDVQKAKKKADDANDILVLSKQSK